MSLIVTGNQSRNRKYFYTYNAGNTMSNTSIKTICTLSFCFLLCHHLFAHNGRVAYAYPLSNITVDGDFSDWPQNSVKYMIIAHLSDTKPKDGNDFSGFFQVGYRLDNRSLYVAFTVTDDVSKAF